MKPANGNVLGLTQEQLSGYHAENVDLKCDSPEELIVATRKAACAKMSGYEREACRLVPNACHQFFLSSGIIE